MALVVETGAGLSNSNSYVTLTESNDYLLLNKYYADTWDAGDDDIKENCLILSTSMLDNYMDWFGTKTVEASALRWPRTGVVDLDGIEIDDNTIPQNLKKAVCELAYSFYIENRQAEPDSLGISELKVDVIELKFDKNEKKLTFPPSVFPLLRSYGRSTMGSRTIKVLRS